MNATVIWVLIGVSQTPIIPIIIGDDDRTLVFWKALFDAGVYTNPVLSPGVPQGLQLLRTSKMATHTDAQLEKVLSTFKSVGTRLGVI